MSSSGSSAIETPIWNFRRQHKLIYQEVSREERKHPKDIKTILTFVDSTIQSNKERRQLSQQKELIEVHGEQFLG